MYKVSFNALLCIAVVGDVVTQTLPLPQITAISPNQTQTKFNFGPATPASFFCSVANIAGFDVEWKRFNNRTGSVVELLSKNTSLITNDTRFSVTFDSSTSSFNLLLSDVQFNDDGTYICEIPVNGTPITRQTELELRITPFFFDNSTGSQFTVDVNTDANIECYAGGWPVPNVYITRGDFVPFRDNRTVFQGSVLEIENIAKKDEGNYRCYANNTVSDVFKFIVVEVHTPPIIRTCTQIVNYPDVTVSLECIMESHVTPNITWIENNGRQYPSLGNESNFESAVTSNGKLFTATLKVNHTIINDTFYTISTKNSLGQRNATVGYFLGYPTLIPPSPSDHPTQTSPSDQPTPIPSSPSDHPIPIPPLPPDCPTSGCGVSYFFTTLFLIIIIALMCVGGYNWNLVRKFKFPTRTDYRSASELDDL